MTSFNADVIVISGVTSAQIQLQVAASHTVANEGETIDFVCRVTNAKYGDLIYLTKQVINEGEAPVSVRPPQPHRQVDNRAVTIPAATRAPR